MHVFCLLPVVTSTGCIFPSFTYVYGCKSSMEGFLGGGVVELKTTQSWAHFPNTSFDIVVLAVSAGGLTALSRILAALPADFPAVLVIVQHLDPRHRSLMADILSRRTALQVQQATGRESLCPGTVYIAPPNRTAFFRSTVEELETTNEELETMNEELQSSNEELQTMNDELRQHTDDLNQANAFLESVLASLPAGAIAIDRNFIILMWNHQASALWGLRAEEVRGQRLLSGDTPPHGGIGVRTERLAVTR
jgi:PAS domain-containing protein